MNLENTVTIITVLIILAVYISAIIASINIAKIKEEITISRKQGGEIINLLKKLIENQDRNINNITSENCDEKEIDKELLKIIIDNQKKQTEILKNISETDIEKEKRKIQEKWQKVTEIINNIDEN